MRMPLPESIQNAPVLFDGLEIYLVAFLDLTSCRGATMAGMTPIPWTAIDRYCVANGFTGDQREDAFYFIRKLDHETLKEKASSGG